MMTGRAQRRAVWGDQERSGPQARELIILARGRFCRIVREAGDAHA